MSDNDAMGDVGRIRFCSACGQDVAFDVAECPSCGHVDAVPEAVSGAPLPAAGGSVPPGAEAGLPGADAAPSGVVEEDSGPRQDGPAAGPGTDRDAVASNPGRRTDDPGTPCRACAGRVPTGALSCSRCGAFQGEPYWIEELESADLARGPDRPARSDMAGQVLALLAPAVLLALLVFHLL